MKSIIVTGANGFIGSRIVQKFLQDDTKVFAVSRNNNNLPYHENLQFIKLDMQNIHKLKDLIGESLDIFYHFAWAGAFGDVRADMRLQLLNIQYTVDAVKIAKDLGCKRFVGAGSIAERDALAAMQAQGNKPASPSYIYGAAKIAAHSMSKSVAASLGIDHIWSVIGNLYGIGATWPFVNAIINKIINNEPLQFTAATQNYDFVYIDDAIEALYRIGLYGKAFHEYYIGSPNAQALKNFILEIQDVLCPEQKMNFGDIAFTGVNLPLKEFSCEDIEKDTGFKATTAFADGLKKTAEWLRRDAGL